MLDESRSDSRRRNAQIPMLIGVTGHRDLASTEVHDLRAHIRAFFLGLIQSYPDVPLLLATSLSEGADLLVTEEALALGIDCFAILPMPLDQYRKEFSCQDAVQRFERALGRCSTQILCVNETCSTDSSGSRPLAGSRADASQGGPSACRISFGPNLPGLIRVKAYTDISCVS